MDSNGKADGRKAVIVIRDMTKVYQMGEYQVRALNGVSIEIAAGEFVAIMGPSGSGKSTMMNMLGALDQPTSGTYLLDGIDVSALSDDDLADIRNRKIGFVFQNFNLLPRMPAIQQVELPLIYAAKGGRQEQARRALEMVGLGERTHHRPSELSGGQQQRVAIARALVNEPAIILADEPTGNLDSKSGTEVMAIFQRLNSEQGITILFVTHDPWIARHTRRIITLADGVVVRDEIVPEPLVAGKSVRPSDEALVHG
ncbi:ABC transporter ATP-binding protein [Promineifilum sp.]|uniref:ABC transporter ATP-binding protein n=1 Tax=Promineifilum sp. TaxID=2664178 RepID=UPI0035AEA0C8